MNVFCARGNVLQLIKDGIDLLQFRYGYKAIPEPAAPLNHILVDRGHNVRHNAILMMRFSQKTEIQIQDSRSTSSGVYTPAHTLYPLQTVQPENDITQLFVIISGLGLDVSEFQAFFGSLHEVVDRVGSRQS